MFRFLLSIFIVFNLAITPSLAQSSVLNPQSIQTSNQEVSYNVVSSQNYLSSALVPANRIVKWQKMPINVYIQNNLSKDKYSKIIESAFQEWQIASDRTVVFKRVYLPENADITVIFVDKVENEVSSKAFQAGITKPSYRNDTFLKSEIMLLKNDPLSKKSFTEKQMHIIALHEIGHSIGIVGHSPNKDDVMYYRPSFSTQGLSQKDIDTLKLIYSPQAKNFKVTPYVIQQKITEAKSYIQEFPKSPYSWLKLADLYRANGQYQEAIIAYNRAIKIDKKYFEAYYAIALCYYRMNNIPESFEYFQLALQKEPENTKYINAYTRICIETNQKDKAKKYLSNYLQKHPNAKKDVIIQDTMNMLTK